MDDHHKGKAKTIRPEEAAVELGVSRATAYRGAARGDIPAIRVGSRILILREPFEQLLRGELREQLLSNVQSSSIDARRPGDT
jgi:excisionase family DNA binding protein